MKTIFTYSLSGRLFAAKAVMILCFLSFISSYAFSQKKVNPDISTMNLSYSTGVYRTTATLTATLTFMGGGISDQTVIFYLGSSTELGTATTNINGVATITISLTADGTPTGIPLSAAQHTIRAAYNGDGEYYPSSALAGLTVTDANSDLALTNSTGSYGGSATLSATLTQAGINEPAAGEPVTFSLGSPATNVGTATTDANGVATLTISLTADGTPTGTLLSAGTYNIAAAFAGDDTAYNASNSPTASLTVNAAPFISVSGTPAALNTSAGTASSSTSFNILGPYLTPGNVTVSAPAGFDVSADNSTWSTSGGSITIAETGALSTPIYVQLDAADAANAQGNYSGNIVISGGGAATVNVSVPPSTVSTTINAITAGSDWSNAGTITYTVTFGATVTGLSAGNFSLTTSGAVSGAGISSISSGTNSYTVTVNTGTGDGTIGLNLANATGLPVISTTLPFTGGITNIDKTPPTITVGDPSVSSIVDGAGSVTYSVTFADANFNTSTLSTSDITLNTTGTAGGTLGLTQNSATSYTVTISGITGAGTLGITIAAGTASDLAGNLTPAGGPSATFTVISPVISITGTPLALSTRAGTASGATDIEISGTNLTPGNITVTAPAGFDVSADNETWTGAGGNYTIAETGTLSLRYVFIRLDAADVAGTYSGNVAISGGGATVNVSMPASSVSTTINSGAATSAYSNASSITFTVVFGTAITGLSTSNFSLTTTGTISGATVSSVGSGTNSYTVTVNTGTGSGNISLNLANATGLPPITTPLPFRGGTTVVDKTPPTITIGAPSVSTMPDGGGSVTYSVTYADANFKTSSLTSANITLNKTGSASGAIISVTGLGTSYTVTVGSISGLGTLGISIAAGTATDQAGNTAPASSPSATFNVVQPIISTTGTPSALSTTSGTASSSTSFNVSGNNMAAGVLVTPPSGFEVSTDNSTFSSTVTVGSSGTISSTPVYIRLLASDADNTYSGNIVLTSTGATAVDVSMPSSAVTTPAISTSGTPSALSTTSGTASSSTSFTVSGANMEAGILVTPPSGFEVSLNNSTFSSTVTVGSSGTISSTQVYIRLMASDADNAYSGNIVLTSTGATTVDVSMPSSAVTTPVISTSGTPLALSTTSGTASASTSFNVSGGNMEAGILVTPPSGFEVSTDNTTFSSTVTVGSSGTISSTPVYIRLLASDADNTYSGNIVLTSTGATTVDVSMPPSAVTTPVISTSGTPLALSTTSGTASASTSFNVSGANMEAGILVTPPSGFEVSLNGSTFSNTITVGSSGAIPLATVLIRLSASDADNTYSGNIVLTSTGATPVNVSMPSSTVTTPVISTTGTPSALSTTSGTASSSTSFNISGANMEAGILVTPPAGFEVSTDNSTFSNTVTVGSSGTISSTPVYIRLQASDADNTYSGNIVFTSTGATTVDVSLPSSAVTTPVISASGTPLVLSTTSGTASTSTSFNVSGANMEAGILVSPPAGFEVSTDNSTFSSTVTVGSSGTISSTPVYIRLMASDADNTYSGNIVLTSTGATPVNVNMPSSTVTTPVISTTGTPSALSTTSGTASSSTSFNVSGANMEAGILVTPPTGFEVSLDNSTFSSTVMVGSSGTIPSTPVYIRLSALDADNTYSGNIVLTSTGATTVDVSMPSGTVTTPAIYAFGTPSALSTTSGIASASTSFYVYGLYMETGILITPPTGFEVSLNNSTFTNTVTANITGGGNKVYETQIFIRLKASDADNTYSGNVVLTSTGATPVDVSMPSSAVTTPLISATGTPSALSATFGTASSSTSFNVSGSNLTDNITVTAPAGFDVSLDNTTWSSSGGSQTITQSGGAISSTPVYIQLDAGDAVNGYSGNVVLTSSGATTVNVPVSGTVTIPVISTSGTPSALSTTAGTASLSTSFDVSGTNLTSGNLTVTAPAGFDVSPDNSTWSASGGNFTIAETGTLSSTPVYIRLDAGDAANSYSGNVIIGGGGAATVNQAVSGTVTNPPTLTISPAEGILSLEGTPSGSTGVGSPFTISGSNLTPGNITVTAPSASVVVRTSSTGYSQTLTIPETGTLASTTIYVAISAAASPGEVLGNVTISGGGAATQDLTVMGSASNPPSITVPGGTITLPGTTTGTAGSSTSFNISGSDLDQGNFTVTAPAGIQVSSNNLNWVSSYSFSPGGGSLSSTPVYVRIAATSGVGPVSGNVSFSDGITTVTQAVSGPVTAPGTTISSLSAVTSTLTNAASVQYTAIFAASISGLSASDFTLNTSGSVSGASISSVTASGAAWTITVNTGTGDGTIQLEMNSSSGVSPSVSNTGFTGDTYTIDKTPPTVTIGAPSATSIGNNGSGSVSYIVTYADANFNTSNLTASGITLNGTGTATGTIGVTGSGTSYTVTISNISGLGTLGINVGAGYSSDLAGNTDAGAGPSTPFNVLSSDATLSNLTASAVLLTPAFTPGQTSYTANAPNAIQSITVTPTTNNANAAVMVNSIPVNSGTASGSIPLALGANTITIAVTAQDGVTTDTYTIVITRAPNTNLGFLYLSKGTLSPAFATGTTSYTASVPYSVSSITATPTTQNALTTITVNGNPVSSGTASGSIPLNVGPNTISTVITGQDGATTTTYTVVVTRAEGLSSLALSNGGLSPGFNSNITNYTASVGSGISSITVTPTTNDPTATIAVNSTTVNSGTASGSIPLNVGANTITTTVTPQSGTGAQTYTVTVTRAPSSNANLGYLGLSKGTLSPVFAAATSSYTASVPYSVSGITITPTTQNANSKVTVNGNSVTPGTASGNIPLSVGANTITTIVTAQDGTTTDTYTAIVTRAEGLTSLALSAGGLTPGFNSATTSYTASVGSGVTAITLTPTTNDATATITVNTATVSNGTASGSIPLNVGQNTITVTVTPQSGTGAQTYTVTVNRAPSSNANLGYLSVSHCILSPAFAAATTSYTASVANSISSITVTPTTQNASSTVMVNNVSVNDGTASGPILLNVGANTITTIVTAQDGTTTNTYTVTVTRAPGAADVVDPISVTQPTETPQLADDGILVHRGVSPNGDGIEDFLQIDNITQYPDNHLLIMNRNGQMVYEIKGYDNSTKVFDGHSNKTGQMQLPGTYFFELDYTANSIIKHKTGFLVLKY